MKLGMLFSLIGVCLFGFNQEALDKIVTDYAKAWNEQSGYGFGTHFADDASFVNMFGARFEGKEAIEERHIAILASFLKDSKFEVNKTDFREVAPGVVIGYINWTVQGYRRPCCGPNAPGRDLKGVFMQVFVEKDGVWEIVSSQNTAEPLRMCG